MTTVKAVWGAIVAAFGALCASLGTGNGPRKTLLNTTAAATQGFNSTYYAVE